MFALSTSWNASKLEGGTEIAREIAQLGFKAIELNFSLTSRMVEDISLYCRKNGIDITSLHNYCPIPDNFKRHEALPDCYSLSSLNEEERKQAVFFTKRSILTAKAIGAKAVVLHSGRVEIQDHTRLLIDLHNKKETRSDKFISIFNSFVEERRVNAGAYVEQVIKSYQELLPIAEDNNIILGVENRFYYREIPAYDEFAVILEHFKSKAICYWHDVGHAFILEKLGFMPDGSLIRRYADRLGGIHLHNIKNLIDHQAPIDGDFDFNTLRPYVKSDTIKTIEMSRHVQARSIRESHTFLKELFGD